VRHEALRPPLDGVRVVDMSQVLAGPYCALVLGQLGAAVVKVEPPQGDASRQVGPFLGDQSLYFHCLNDGKRVTSLDIRTSDGRMRLLEEVRHADVVVQNLRAESARRLGVSPADLMDVNPDVVVVTVQGFATGTPMEGHAAYDVVIQALSGIMALTGEPDGPPVRAGVPLSDLTAGLWAVIAALCGLVFRAHHGRGGHLEVPMLDASMSLLTYAATGAAAENADPERVGNAHPAVTPYGSFDAADGPFVLAVYQDKFWPPMCRALGLDDLGADPTLAQQPGRLIRREELRQRIQEAVRGRSRSDVIAALQAHDVPCGPVLGVSEAMRTDYAIARGVLRQGQDHAVDYQVVSPPVRGIAPGGSS